ncbi:MAG: AzlC family ABC transporter permease [Treponema sp.]|nr:AzlC family ABC transporter permease [Treponema sp.]
MTKEVWRQAARTTIPVLFGYIAIGIPAGLMIVDAGYPWWLAPVMSVTMYAGAGQYMAAGLFATGASLGTIALTELLLNIRHLFYGFSLLTKFTAAGAWKVPLIFLLTDETYSLLTTTAPPEQVPPGRYYAVIALLDWSYWIIGSTIGAVAGTVLPFNFAGVDFALTALFAVLLMDQIEQTHDISSAAIGALVTVGMILLARLGVLPPEHILLASLTCGIVVLIIRHRADLHRTAEEHRG